MPTYRRLAVYGIFCLPIAYSMGITFLSQRVTNYRVVFYAFGLLFVAAFFNWLFSRTFSLYRRVFQPRISKEINGLKNVITALMLVALLAVTPLLSLIAIGIFPLPFIVLTMALPVYLTLQSAFKEKWPAIFRLDIFVILLIYIYTSLIVVGITRFGSTDKTCKNVTSSPFLIPIVTREDIANTPTIANCFPYDIKSDPEADMLFFTLKERRSGFIKTLRPLQVPNDAICATRLSSPRLDPSLMIPIVGKSTATYPQRITVNPEKKEIYVVVLDIDGQHSVKVVSYDNEWRIKHSIALDFEPIRVYVDKNKNRLIILGYAGFLETYDAKTYDELSFKKREGWGFIVLRDTLVHNDALKAYYASAVFQRFALLDDSNFETVLKSPLLAPTIGLDYHKESNRVYTAGTMTHEIIVLDGTTLEVIDRIWTGTTVRELYIDHTRDMIVTAGYADGYLDFYNIKTHKLRARTFVGKLARGIHIEQKSGRVFVASSCGLFEVRIDKLLASANQN